MPIGFPSYEEETAPFRGVERRKLLRAAEEALDELGWSWYDAGRWRLTASSPAGFFFLFFFTWGERVIVEVHDGEVWVRSEGNFPLAWLDLGQHRANINKFLERLEDVLEDRAP
jgi:hypothetical protein